MEAWAISRVKRLMVSLFLLALVAWIVEGLIASETFMFSAISMPDVSNLLAEGFSYLIFLVFFAIAVGSLAVMILDRDLLIDSVKDFLSRPRDSSVQSMRRKSLAWVVGFGIVLMLVLAFAWLMMYRGVGGGAQSENGQFNGGYASLGGSGNVFVAFVYSTDFGGAQSFKGLLETFNISVNLVSEANMSQLDSCGLIIVGDDAVNLESSVVNGTGKPILGLGVGGFNFFNELGLFSGYEDGKYAYVYAVSPEHQVFVFPNNVSVSYDQTILLYAFPVETLGVNPSNAQSNTLLGKSVDQNCYLILALHDARYVFWGFSGSPTNMTQAGKNLFVNIVVWMLGEKMPSGVSTVPELPPALSALLVVSGVILIAAVFVGSFLFIKAVKEVKEEADAALMPEEETLQEKAMTVFGEAISEIKARESDLSFRAAIIKCYERLCELLAQHGCQIQEHETVQEFRASASKILNIPDKPFSTLTNLFEEARYSLHEIDEAKRNEALNCLEDLRRHLASGKP
ncbi:MAG: DUF4129 domain-containing protein [Candidatus Bathyarchaeia archaeon]